jgi:toxin-antitoxin system PIN domain toxin
VNLVDANVLLYAVNVDAAQHGPAKRWLDAALSGSETVALAWVPLLAFVRLSTRAGLFPRPLTSAQAFDVVDAWLSAAPTVMLHPGHEHISILRSLLAKTTAGNLVNDAHLAALAIEHNCRVVSFDSDFSRFKGITWISPAESVVD